MLSPLRRLSRMIETFRAVDPSSPTRFLAVLVEVALNEGVPLQELADRLRFPSASISRTVAAPGYHHWIKGKAGLGLVQTVEDGRAKRAYLTKKGKTLVERMGSAMEGRAMK